MMLDEVSIGQALPSSYRQLCGAPGITIPGALQRRVGGGWIERTQEVDDEAGHAHEGLLGLVDCRAMH